MSTEDLQELRALLDSVIEDQERGQCIAMTNAEKARFQREHAQFDLVIRNYGIKRLEP